MVKFSDPIFQDAYLCSLRRQHDDNNALNSSTYQSTSVVDKEDRTVGDVERYANNDEIYTSTTFKSGSNKHNQYHTTSNKHSKQQQFSIKPSNHLPLSPHTASPPPPRYTKVEEVEDYITNISPIIQRSKARQLERNSFLDWADSQLGSIKDSNKDGGATSTDEGSIKEGRNDEGSGGNREDKDGDRSTRMKKLWDFDNIDTSYVKVDDREDEQRDDDNISMYKQTSSIRDPSSANTTNFNSNSNLTNSTYNNSITNNPNINSKSKPKKEIWTASKIRQESRHDITKQLNNDLTEIEMFMSSMKERIKLYGTDGKEGVVGKEDHENGGGKDDRVAAVEDGSDDNGDNKEKELGVRRERDMEGKESATKNELQLTHTQSSSAESTPTDDGYGKQVRSPHYTNTSHKSVNGNNNHEINNLINKFQRTRIKQSRHYLVQGDELMNCNTTNTNIDDRVGEHRTYREPIMTKEKQAIKIATYTGMNQQDMTTKKDNGGCRAAKESGYDYTISSPRETRLKRMQELKKKHQLVIDEDRKSEPPPPPPPPPPQKEDNNDEKEKNKKKDIDMWWDEHKLKQGHKQQQQRYKDRRGMETDYNIDDELERWWKEKRRNDTPNKTTFVELEEEPTISDPDPSPFTSSTTNASTTIGTSLALPPLSPMNTIPTKRAVEGSSSTSSSSSKRKNVSHLSHTFRLKSRQLGSPLPIQRGGSSSSIDGPLLQSTSSESSTLTDENIDQDVEDTNIDDEVEEQSSSSSSVLSEDAIKEEEEEEEEEDRCQSLAQSTLSMLLLRIDEAKASFTQALLDGDAVKQAELASLLTRLGEAAVTMRKLEQTA